MKNKYQLIYTYKGYVRTKNDYSGIIEFEESFIIDANTKIEAVKLSNIYKKGKIKENFIHSNFEMNFDNDEIIRDDTEESLEFKLIYLSYNNFIKIFNKLNNFILNVSKKDLITIRKAFYRNKSSHHKNLISESIINQAIWNLLDKKYFLPNKIRFDVKELNLNQILPETYFKKTIITPTLTFYKNEINDREDLINFLNNIINKENIILEKKEIHKKELSNNQKRKIEKNKERNKQNEFFQLIKEKKKEFILNLKESLKEKDLEKYTDSFFLDIKIK